jgi:UDP-N-acetylglucosamine--N-acetylmuramyl-(pentapeptide) pyrophosphoryl-undecaprenol N-acetylglucosamine transferase
VSLSVLLAGGGTTGHVGPLLALADCLRRRDPQVRITVLGTAGGLETRLVPAAGYPLEFVPKVALPRRPTPAYAQLPFRLRAAVLAAERAARRAGADVVVGFGGYVASPAYLAARRLRLPIVVHEQNARPGIANRLGARLTRFVTCALPDTPLRGARLVGMPLRRNLTQLDRAAERAAALAGLGLADRRPVLLVTGGSLGARRLNQAITGALPRLLDAGVQVLHVTGAGKLGPAPEPAGGYLAREYLDRMDLAYAAADAVLCRAGASTVSELAMLGLPAVYVPLPVGNGEQRFNAMPLVAAGGGLLLPDAGCTPDWVAGELLPLLTDQPRLAEMGRAAMAFGIRDGDERLADVVLEAARGRVS